MIKKLSSKKIITFIFAPLVIVFIIAGFLIGSIYQHKEKNVITDSIDKKINYTYNELYLLDKNNTLVPLTIKYESFDTKGEEIMYIISNLKTNSQVSNIFTGIIPSNTKVNNLNLNNKVLEIDFDENFKTYEAKNELKILESLTWTLTSLDYIDGLYLSISGNRLKNMPVNNTPINGLLTKQIGINNFLLTSTIIEQGQRVLSYYEKVIDDKYYYVPVTHYVNNKDGLSIYDLTIQTLFVNPGITSSLNVCRCLENTSMVTSSILNDNILYLSLSEDILFDELTVSYDVYKIMKEVTILLDNVNDVSFLMDLEEIKVNNFTQENESKVSKIELNKYYI